MREDNMDEMSESLHAAKMREKYPCPEPDPAQEIRVLRTLIVEEGKVGFLGSNEEAIQHLKRKYPAAYEAFCQEYKRKVLERSAYSPYLEEKAKELSGSEDGEKQLRKLRGMRSTMIKFKLGYGGYVMGMIFGKTKNAYPEAYEAFERVRGAMIRGVYGNSKRTPMIYRQVSAIATALVSISL